LQFFFQACLSTVNDFEYDAQAGVLSLMDAAQMNDICAQASFNKTRWTW